jgi:hypothetical protein
VAESIIDQEFDAEARTVKAIRRTLEYHRERHADSPTRQAYDEALDRLQRLQLYLDEPRLRSFGILKDPADQSAFPREGGAAQTGRGVLTAPSPVDKPAGEGQAQEETPAE